MTQSFDESVRYSLFSGSSAAASLQTCPHNVLKGIQNGTSGSSGDLLEASRSQGRTREQLGIRFIQYFGATWRFGMLFWRPLDFDGGPKSDILK